MKYLIFLFVCTLSAQNVMITEMAKKKASGVATIPIAVVDSSADKVSAVSVTYLAQIMTVSDLSNGYLVVAVAGFQQVNSTSVTWNSVAMDSIGGHRTVGGQSVTLFGLKNPSETTDSIRVTFTSGVAEGAIQGVSFSNVNQTTSVGTPAGANGNNVTPTVDVTSATNELVISGLSTYKANVLSNNTMVASSQNSPEYTSCYVSKANGAASVTMSYSQTSGTWSIVGIPLKPL